MPVEPLPCGPDGGTGTPGDCACAPSIAATPLCRADGTTVLVVVRSPCGTCGTAPADPAVVGWIDPVGGVFTAGSAPADAGPCTGAMSEACSCAPSITSMPLCRADGSTIALIIRSACTACGATPTDPGVVGWLDPVTGLFTPGLAPADAQPCQLPGCVDTVCRQRCDDTTGDGTPDATYSELWCIGADGTAELVLIYQDDPSVPYAPVSPVDCTYGCPDDETVMLCDASGPFLRRYSFLAGTATYVDVALDGQTPHVVSGTVGTCPACDPSPPLALVGLCLADGTPIAVLVSRACDGTTTRNGWLNLLTGVYSTGAPPAGTGGCTAPGAFELAGVLCDTDPATGEVLGLALVQYVYAPDGSLASVQLLNPADGTAYHLQGELRNCPTGQALPGADLVVLCDDNGPFVRDYRRDQNTLIVGHTDYHLDGTGYQAVGTVRLCPPEPDCPAQSVLEACRCDDANGDGAADTDYVELLAVDCTGAVASIGTYLPDYSAPYAPVAPIDCAAGADLGAPDVFGVQAGRVVLAPGQSWEASSVPTLQAVTATASGGAGTVTTGDGTSPLTDGERAAWTVARDVHARLTGPLVITAVDGTVTVDYSREVQL